jgi:hypothetical protein
MTDISSFENRIYSQNGEDGITEILLKLIYLKDTNNKYYVEFGVENGTECNTRILREKYNWTGLLMDGGNSNPDINLNREFINRDNVVNLFEKYNVPKHFQYLCVDIDSNDFYCVDEILKNYKTDIIVCEYNGTHLPTEDKVVKYKSTQVWDGSNYMGTSLLAITKLCNAHGYSLVYCDKRGVNAFFIRSDIPCAKKFKNVDSVSGLYRAPTYGNGPNGGHPVDFKNRTYITSDEARVCENTYENEPVSDVPQNEMCKMNLTPDIKMTYAVQVCNESRELYSLLNFLLKFKTGSDEINVVVDSLHKTKKVESVLEYFKKHINIFERPFDNFCINAQYHLDIATGDYIFGLDADEMPQEELMKNIKRIISQSGSDLIWIPRINIHPGLTGDFIRKSGFNVNNVGWINWPDYQGRILKKCDYISWTNEVHTKLTGAKKPIYLPENPGIAIWHIKSMEKQNNRWEKDENNQYTIFHSPSESNFYDMLM